VTPSDNLPARYEIRVAGHLDARWADWFDGLALTLERGGTTLLSGVLADQAALHGTLQKVRDAGLPLISVHPVDTSGSTP
jgi:hypothetical protein